MLKQIMLVMDKNYTSYMSIHKCVCVSVCVCLCVCLCVYVLICVVYISNVYIVYVCVVKCI